MTLPSVSAANVSDLLRGAGKHGLYLAFTAATCSYCKPYEGEWERYAMTLHNTSADGSAPFLPGIARVDTDGEQTLASQHDITDLPSLVLAWHGRWMHYAGPHTSAAMAAFGSAQLAPAVIEIGSGVELQQLIDDQRQPSGAAKAKKGKKGKKKKQARSAGDAPPQPLLLLGFFNDPHGDEAEELEDFTQAAADLRKLRNDVAVRAAYVRLTPALESTYIKSLRWLEHAPSAVLLIGGSVTAASGSVGGMNGGADAAEGWSKYAYRLDVPKVLTLSEWAARAALPLLGELTPLTFAAYAATSLPMLIAFVERNEASDASYVQGGSAASSDAGAPQSSITGRGLRQALRSVGERFRGKLVAVTCDGQAQRTRMISLGLDADGPLPQLAFNTKDGRQLPFPRDQAPTVAALTNFAADFLGERLPPRPARPPPQAPSTPPSSSKPKKAGGGSGQKGAAAAGKAAAAGSDGAVVELNLDDFERVALDVTKDVLLLLHAAEGCERCTNLVPYYKRVGERAAQLGLSTSFVVAQLDVKKHTPLPAALKAVNLHDIPTVLMLPAKRKEPPFRLFHGDARPKELLYFAQAHASRRFELPPNPHLTREQHEAWKEQVEQLPPEKVAKAYEKLKEETGLEKDEV
jgi:hypothetical protein